MFVVFCLVFFVVDSFLYVFIFVVSAFLFVCLPGGRRRSSVCYDSADVLRCSLHGASAQSSMFLACGSRLNK